jgi:hypothetical protein
VRKLDEILEQARLLSAEERRKLIETLEQTTPVEAEANGADVRRNAALDRWLQRAGTGTSESTDVARDKYKHLADSYASKK